MQKVAVKKSFYISPGFLLVGSFIVFVSFITVATLMSSTRHITKGYVLNSLEADRQELLRQKERHEMEISRVRSLNYIQGSEKVSGMIRAGNVVFIEGDTAIAKR